MVRENRKSRGKCVLACTKFGQLVLRRIVEIVATICWILRLKCTSGNGVYFVKMLSSVGINNVQLYCNHFGLSRCNVQSVCKKLAWSAFHRRSELDVVCIISQSIIMCKIYTCVFATFDSTEIALHWAQCIQVFTFYCCFTCTFYTVL